MSCRVLSSFALRMSTSLFKYNYALVRQIPVSFEMAAIRMDETQVVDFKEARQEIERYKQTLEKCGLTVVEVEKDESYPDCVFVEDTAIVIGQKALVTTLGHKTRRGEIGPIKAVLQDKLKLDIVTMDESDGSTIDGGDVLFTGREFFVGESTRTNAKGIEKIANTFPQYPVTSIPVHSTVLHLKSIATMFGEETMAVGGSSAAKEMFQQIKNKAKFQYEYIELDNDQSSNGLYINGILVHKPQEEIGDKDYEKITSSIKTERIETGLREMYKVDGCLSCCSVLINA